MDEGPYPIRHETEVLRRIIRPRLANMTPEAAKAILMLRLADQDQERINELSTKSGEGTLTADEEAEIRVYRVLDRVISMMWSKARVSLKKSGADLAILGDE